uniref:Uncharacterized protein n=1 Tax=Chenopodium quinoa TaxID=63459 RepID=A0A803M1X9_CHEQI
MLMKLKISIEERNFHQEETLASGCVQQEAYVLEPLTTSLASGCVHQHETRTPESLEMDESLVMLLKEPVLNTLEVLDCL